MVSVINNPYQWRVILPDETISWSRFADAWAYAQPDADEGWLYLSRATTIARLANNENRIVVAWRPRLDEPDEQIVLEWF